MNERTRQFSRFMRTLTATACAAGVMLTLPAYGQEDEGINVNDMGTVDSIVVQDADLAQVLQMLSIETKKNIIASKNVSGTVTANLYNVTFYEALDNILKVNGFTYVEEGNFIYVYTIAEKEALDEAMRKTVSRTFELDYISAADAQQIVTPLLSTAGQLSSLGSVNPGFIPTIDDGGTDEWAYNAKLVVNDYPDVLESIAELLSDADTPPQQVLVEAAILATRLTEDNAFGIDFSVVGGFDFEDLLNPLSSVDELIDGIFTPSAGDLTVNSVQSTVGGTSGAGGLKIGVMSNDISVFMRLLDDVSDTTVIARPKVLALNRQRAQVLVGRRVGYLSTTATQTTTTQTVEFLDTGVQLIFRPFISRDGSIRMELAPSVSEAILRDVTDSTGNIVTIPDEDTNEITTNVRVQSGKTIVLGGLFRESTRVTKRNVPFFGDIPIIGAAFKGQEDVVDRTEITFLITPTIVKDDALNRIGSEMLENINRVRVGARSGLLPFSRESLTANYNMDALNAFNDGDTELALFYINNSLNMHKNQPDVRQLQQKITGAKVREYERSMLQKILEKELRSLQDSSSSSRLFESGLESTRTVDASSSLSQSFDDLFYNSFTPQGFYLHPVANVETDQE
ncbi:MAG: hypothetical protein O7G85_11685 [Planctomycetota bacterium]|nr:hypothetical protein [Planctomycetota bacterium]